MLDGATGVLRWSVEQRPIPIYSYAPALVAGDAAVVRNCLNMLASNSLCVYNKRPEQPGRAGAAGADVAGAGISGAAAQAAAPLLVALLCVLLPLLL